MSAQKPYNAREDGGGAIPLPMLERLPEKASATSRKASKPPLSCPNCRKRCYAADLLSQHLRFHCKVLRR